MLTASCYEVSKIPNALTLCITLVVQLRKTKPAVGEFYCQHEHAENVVTNTTNRSLSSHIIFTGTSEAS